MKVIAGDNDSKVDKISIWDSFKDIFFYIFIKLLNTITPYQIQKIIVEIYWFNLLS